MSMAVIDCGGPRYVLAELLDLLDLAGQLGSEGLLQRLQFGALAGFSTLRGESTNSGLGGVAAEAIEGGRPQRGGSAEGAGQSQCRGHCGSCVGSGWVGGGEDKGVRRADARKCRWRPARNSTKLINLCSRSS